MKRDSHQGVIAFLSEEGIDDGTSDEADTEEEATADALATSEQNTNHEGNDKNEPRGDESPKTASTLVGAATCPVTPATVILPVTVSPLQPTVTTATTPATATTSSSPSPSGCSGSSSGNSSGSSSGSSDTTSQSSEPTMPAAASASIDDSPANSDDTCPPPPQEQEAHKRSRKPCTRGFGPQTTVDGKHTVLDVPNHYSLIYGSKLAELQQDAKSYHKLKSALLGQEKCNWNPLARRHLAAGMMQIPHASFTGVEQLIPCVVAAIFAAADIKVNPENLSKSCPSENLLQEIVRDGAVDCLLWLMDELKKAHAVVLTAWLRYSVGGTKLSDASGVCAWLSMAVEDRLRMWVTQSITR